jgi:hypothetical protein
MDTPHEPPDNRNHLVLATTVGTWRFVFRSPAGAVLTSRDGLPIEVVTARGGCRRSASGVARGAVAFRCGIASSHVRAIECEPVDDEARWIDANLSAPSAKARRDRVRALAARGDTNAGSQ